MNHEFYWVFGDIWPNLFEFHATVTKSIHNSIHRYNELPQLGSNVFLFFGGEINMISHADGHAWPGGRCNVCLCNMMNFISRLVFEVEFIDSLMPFAICSRTGTYATYGLPLLPVLSTIFSVICTVLNFSKKKSQWVLNESEVLLVISRISSPGEWLRSVVSAS